MRKHYWDSGHSWRASFDNNRAGYWTCSICKKERYFVGVPEPLDGFSDVVKDYVRGELQDFSTCLELAIVEVQTS